MLLTSFSNISYIGDISKYVFYTIVNKVPDKYSSLITTCDATDKLIPSDRLNLLFREFSNVSTFSAYSKEEGDILKQKMVMATSLYAEEVLKSLDCRSIYNDILLSAGECEPVLVSFEKPLCHSYRQILRIWFSKNGCDINEWHI